MEGVRSALLAARAAAQAQLGELAADVAELIAANADSNGDDEHDPEGATIAFERAQVQSLAERARQRVAEIDRALDRLAQGRYGECASCGEPIAAARLAARPSATSCVACAGADQVRPRVSPARRPAPAPGSPPAR